MKFKTYAWIIGIKISKINNKFRMKIIKVIIRFIIRFLNKMETRWSQIKFAD